MNIINIRLFIVFILFTSVFLLSNLFAQDNLEELIARRSRQTSATWGAQYLENPQNNYTWQPESVCYYDTETGTEVWVLIHAPDREEIYSKEHGTNVWSFDGSRIGFFSSNRGTQNPIMSNSEYQWRWIVNTDGSGLRACEGYGRRDFPFDGFSWGHNGPYYFTFGSGSGENSNSYTLYKCTYDENNVISGTEVINTSPVDNTKKEMLKDGIGMLDAWVVVRGGYSAVYGTPNNISTSKIYFINIETLEVHSHWGIARGCGPASDPYGDHSWSRETRFHDAWSPGPRPSWMMGQFSGTGVFWIFNRDGSYTDNGPLWEDWNGNSFGENEEIICISDGADTPDNPYGIPYFGHPVFDRWGKYALVGTYTDSPLPGTRIVDIESKSILPNHVLAYSEYDGQHHSWTGITDYVVGISPSNIGVYINKFDQSYTESKKICNSGYSGSNSNYNAYPRPSQSPDGTKIAFAQYTLNNGQAYPYIAWAVAYYPSPPTDLNGSTINNGIRLTWEPPKYTGRGWPDENTDPSPYSREIKKYNIWRSTTGNSEWMQIGSVYAQYQQSDIYGLIQITDNLYYNDAPGNGTFYYALTSEEYSGLESKILSEILQITISNGSVAQIQIVQAEGQENFWTIAPSAPTVTSTEAQSAPGHFLISWEEPWDEKIRYYNIYYSTATTPDADPRYLIASVPVGTSSYLDWCAQSGSGGNYRVTSVDRQGNEGINIINDKRPHKAQNPKIGVKH